MKLKILLLAAVAFGTSACSTVVNGSNQSISFHSGDVEGADCKITGGSDHAVNQNFVTPAEVKIPRSKKSLNLNCTKAGYETTEQTVHSKVEGSTAGNIIAGGVIGVGVDALTGAIYKYPETVAIIMTKLGASSADMKTEETSMSEDESALTN